MLKSIHLKSLFALALLALFYSCSSDDDSGTLPGPGGADPSAVLTQEVVTNQALRLNPEGVSPLTALLEFSTSEPVTAHLKVEGRNGVASDVEKTFNEAATTHALPILGLYADFENTVAVTLFDGANNSLGTATFTIQTAPLPSDLPLIVINESTGQKDPGMNLVSYFGHNSSITPQRPFIFDEFGDIRWFLNLGSNPILSNLFYDNGMERLRNGNLYFGDGSGSAIYEINMFGGIVNTWNMPGFSFHHEVHEKPNGNFLVCVNNDNLATIEDHIIEIDRSSGAIIRTWDLRQSLQESRMTLTNDPTDWIHVNAVTYDENDDTIIISGRTQGMIKLTNNNEVVWIVSPHRGWGQSGDGTDLTNRLLQPLDAGGQVINSTAVLEGDANHSDFEWSWYQHAPQVMPNGNVILFDNGDNRNYTGEGPYSRAVEYNINTQNMTIQQVWQYGKERGAETYSRIVSDIDYNPATNHAYFLPGAVLAGNINYGKVIELDYITQQVVFEATIQPPTAPFNITFHRVERLPLYPD